jgi:hypothetical protein
LNAEPDDYRWLTGDEAGRILADEAAATDALQLVSRLRKTLSASRAALVAEQVDLRRRARKKFARAAELFFTKRGLEQATDDLTAAYKASRFPAKLPLADLCCGIGGDLLALGLRGATIGYDFDEVTALFAAANCEVLNRTARQPHLVSAVCKKAEAAHVAEVAAWHIDPDRRPGGKRTTQIELHEPSVETIEELLAASPNAAIKLAPGSEPWPAWRDRAEWEWISVDGECRQLVAWFGSLSTDYGKRRATVLTADRHRSIGGTPDDALSYDERLPVAELGRYVHEPDAAILAADLITTAAREHNLAQLFPGSAYLTSDEAIVDDPAWSSFEVLEALPFDVKKLRAWFAERRIGRLELKKRGVDVDLERLRKELKLSGDEAGCLILLRRGDRVTAVAARRVVG